MLISPVTVNDTALGTLLLSALDSSKCTSIVIQNTGANPVALKYDGSATGLTFANGILLAASNAERVLNGDKGAMNYEIRAIAGAGLTSTIRVHGIE